VRVVLKLHLSQNTETKCSVASALLFVNAVKWECLTVSYVYLSLDLYPEVQLYGNYWVGALVPQKLHRNTLQNAVDNLC
jgi:hypothetical protein